jgi:hypothetical protein
MVSTDTKDQIEFLLAKPFIHASEFVSSAAKHVEHVATVNQDVSGQCAQLVVFTVGITDNGEFHSEPVPVSLV